MATITALLSALPKLISLVSLIMSMVRDAEERGIGRKEAIAEALAIAHRDIAAADAEEELARQSHNQHPEDDGGFDADFKRKD